MSTINDDDFETIWAMVCDEKIISLYAHEEKAYGDMLNLNAERKDADHMFYLQPMSLDLRDLIK